MNPERAQIDLSTLSLPELRALDLALTAAIRGAELAGGGAFEAALLVDAEGVSVTSTIPFNPAERTDHVEHSPQE